MEFALNSTQISMQDALRRFLNAEVAPIVDQHEASHEPVPRSLVKSMADFGIIGGAIDEAAGGAGLPMTTYGMLLAEVARVWPSLRSVASKSTLVARVLAECGSPELKARYLPRLLNGDALACFALSEPNIGSDAAHVETRAERTATGWRINGRKTFISNAPVADVGIVFVKTRNADDSTGVSCLMFENSLPGISCTPLSKMGMHSSTLGELLFEDVDVPAENLIGEPGSAFSIAKRHLNAGRCVAAFCALGIAQASLDCAIRYAKDRVQFGRPIGSFQLIQAMIADMMTLVETSRLLAYRAADALDRNDPENRVLCSMAKRYATDAVLRVAEISLQVHGGAGYTSLFPVERHYRDARHLSIAEGTNQIQGMLMAQQVLGLSALNR